MHDLFRKCSNRAFLYLAKRKLFAIKMLFCKFWRFCSKSGTKIGTKSGTKIALILQRTLYKSSAEKLAKARNLRRFCVL